MTPLVLAIAITATVLAMLSAIADGALQGTPAEPAPGDARLKGLLGRREAVQRALVFSRRLLQLVAGAAMAVPLALADRPTVPGLLVAFFAAGTAVVVIEAFALALGDALGARALMALEPAVLMLEGVAMPALALSRGVDRLLADLLPPPPADRESREARVEQFSEVVAAEAEVSEEEEALLRRILHLRETEVRDIMVPRVDILGVEAGTPWGTVLETVRRSEHARLPVYHDTIDDIRGVLYAKDVFGAMLADAEPAGGWESLARVPLLIPTTKRIDEQLRDFRASRTHIAIVVDEFGGTAGMVTIEDVLEEIVGEIRDEYDDAEPEVRTEDGVRFWVPGRLSLDGLTELTGHRWERLDVATIGGLVLETLGRLPRPGEHFELEGFHVVVEQVRRRAVARVHLERLAPEVDEDGEAIT
jgi:CBS domain containing-hemolysin-like protein